MKTSATGWLMAALAGLLVVGVTVVQGTWTERWVRHDDGGRLAEAAELLERVFPERFGEWVFEQELDSNAQELQRAGAVGHVSKLYRNTRTNARVSAFIVCATPHDASGHTPDRCYPGAGFEIGETEHRHEVKLPNGTEVETFTATFRKAGQTLRIFWTYGIPDGPGPDRPTPEGQGGASSAGGEQAGAQDAGTGRLRWIAPGIARIALSGQPAVYKLYAIIDQTKLTTSQATAECSDFIAAGLAALNEQLVSAGRSGGGDSQPPASNATDAPQAAGVPPETSPPLPADPLAG
jgi:hypothetical protein